jgi:hypothetical protein
VSNTGDRVVMLLPDGSYQVLKDDDAVIRQPRLDRPDRNLPRWLDPHDR